jgi:uncharacterized repeat protein (TIGR01451 family)
MIDLNRLSKFSAAIVLAGLMAACSSSPANEPMGEPAPAPTRAAAPAPAPVTQSPRSGYSWLALPTGQKETSALLIERTAPTSVSLGAPFTYEIKVTNLTDVPLSEVVVTDTTDENFKLASAQPAPTSSSGNRHTWNIGNMAGKESRTILVTGSATKVATLKDCLEATYNTKLCNDVQVTEAKLKTTSQAPATALACDPIPVTYTVTNTGTGTAKNVKLDVALDNLTNDQGAKTHTVNIGDLRAGESKTINTSLKATGPTTATSKATVSGDGNLKIESDTNTTQILKPELTITNSALDMTLLDRDLVYTILVTNKGNGEARNVVIEDAIPSGLPVKSVSDNGVISTNKDKVTWNVGTLAPGAGKQVTVTLVANKISKVDNVASASCYCAPPVSAPAPTDIRGVSAILLEVIDANDPVLLSEDVMYTITTTNQGSALGTNIKIVCTLEANAEFVKADGSTAHTVNGQVITFESVKGLAAKDKAVWHVFAKAKTPGDTRFKVTMTSDQISRPVEETEATTFYKNVAPQPVAPLPVAPK